jgi:nitroreductase
MSEQFPDPDTVRTALSLATRAPSVHGSQPWRWRVSPYSLDLYADSAACLLNTSQENRAMHLSCGVALNHCSIGLAALGWHAKIHRFPNPVDPGHLAAIEFHRRTAAEVDVTLAAAIPRRRTDRRPYSSWLVPHGDLALMGARAARAGVTMRRVEASTDLADLVTRAARQHTDDDEYLTNLAACSGTSDSRGRVFWPDTPKPEQTADAGWVEDNAVVLALGTGDDDDMAHLRAGEATSLVLLTATALGLASCPITEPLEALETRELFRENIFPADGFPQMLLRIGWASVNADPLPAAPRHELSEVIVGTDGVGSAS